MLLIARLMLAVALGLAGAAKLVDLRGTRSALAGFGVPRALVPTVSVLLPLTEFVIALSLLPTLTAFAAAIGATAIGVIFTLAIAANLIRGRTPDCHCFGQLYSAPIGWPTLVRTFALGGAALLVALRGPEQPAFPLPTDAVGLALLLAVVIGGAVLALDGWLLVNLLRQNGRLLVRVEQLEARLAPIAATDGQSAGLPVGSHAPDFELPDLDGQRVRLHDLLRPGAPLLLFFAHPRCRSCSDLLPELSHWHGPALVTVSSGDIDENRAMARRYGLDPVLLQPEFDLGDIYGTPGTPSAVLVGADGTIASALAVGADAIRALIQRLERSTRPVPSAGLGAAPAPHV